jgi:hypothetical protein
MNMNVYSVALACARAKLESYASTPALAPLTARQLSAVRVMIADAWICGYDAADTKERDERTTPNTGGSDGT